MIYTGTMTGTNHTLAGALIAVLIPAPLVPLVAVASHFALDAIPHFGNQPWMPATGADVYSQTFKYWLIFDAIGCFTALFCAWWLFPDKWLSITIGAFFAAGPDFLSLFEKYAHGKFARGFYHFAKKIQWAELPWGWVLELVYAASFIGLLLFIKIYR